MGGHQRYEILMRTIWAAKHFKQSLHDQQVHAKSWMPTICGIWWLMLESVWIQVYEFAFSFPYTYTYLQHTLHWIDTVGVRQVGQECRFLCRKLLCRTPQMRRVDMLVISEPMVELPQAWTSDEFTTRVQRNECGFQASYLGLLQRCRHGPT